MSYRYVPLLRSKAGEVTALHNLSAQAKARLLPVVHLVEQPPATFAQRLTQAWTGLPLALDGLYNFDTTGSANQFAGMFNALGGGGVHVIPSVPCDAPAAYVAAVRNLVSQRTPSLVVKATLRHAPTVAAWVTAQSWSLHDVDLVVDAGEVATYDTANFAPYVQHVLTSAIPQPSVWRTVTLAASAAPRDHSALAAGRNLVPRLDWALWNHLRQQVPFQLDFGDYGVGHPDLTEPPGVAMTRATVSVRYCVDDHWIVLKGRPTTGVNGIRMGQQYIGHAGTLAHDRQFGGVVGCWGDIQIQQIAGGAPRPGNRTTWAGILANRHLSLVADRLP